MYIEALFGRLVYPNGRNEAMLQQKDLKISKWHCGGRDKNKAVQRTTWDVEK